VCEELIGIRQALTGIAADTAKLTECLAGQATQSAAVAQLAERNRQLEEHFFEQELLPAVVRPLIGAVDRAHDVHARMCRTLARHATLPGAYVCASCATVLEYLDLHVLDLHTSLTALGVDSFTLPDPRFDPLQQQCFGRVATWDVARVGTVAERIAPGYRRNGYVIRREQVRVYVTASDAASTTTGV
jgi:hypothetical protein